MTKRLVIDVDSHFMPHDVFDDVDARFEERAPHWWTNAVGQDRVTHPDRVANLNPQQRAWKSMWNWSFQYPKIFYDDTLRVAALDKLHIDRQLLVPSEQFLYDIEPDLGTSICQSYNNAMGRVLQRHPGRFLALANLPWQSPPRAVRELERAVSVLGIHAALVFGNVDGRNLDEPEFWPIYEKLQQLNVPLIIHPARSGKLMGIERGYKFHMENALGFMYEGSFAIASLITGGVLDVFPRLRIGFLETGAGYLPTLMDRLNEVYDHEGVDKLIKKRPHEYLDQFWLAVNVSSERATLPYLVDRFGPERFLFGSDMPHGLGGTGEAGVDELMAQADLTDAQQERILGLNAAELFGL